MGNRFIFTTSNFDRIASSAAIEPFDDPEVFEQSEEHDWNDISPFLEQMAPELSDCLVFLDRDGLTQKALGMLWGITQAAVSFRYIKAKTALKWLLVRKELCGTITKQDVQHDCKGVLTPLEIQVFWSLHCTTCQASTAAALGLRAPKVREIYLSICEKLSSNPSRYLEAMTILKGHWSILRLLPIYIPDSRPLVMGVSSKVRRRTLRRKKNSRKK